MSDAITYKDLVLSIGGISAAIYDVSIMESSNEHGTIALAAILKSKQRQEVLHNNPTVFGLFYKKGEKVKALFQGVITYLKIETDGDHYVLMIQGKTVTYFMDYAARKRSFQNVTMKSHTLIEKVMKEHKKSQSIKSIPNQAIKELVIQYEETDWEFLKRFVSRYGAYIFVNSASLTIQLQIGLSNVEKQVNWDKLPYEIYQNMEYHNYMRSNKHSKATQWQNIIMNVTSYDIVPLGTKVKFQGNDMYVGGVQRIMNKGNLCNTYSLYYAEGLTAARAYNSMIIGISILGTVLAASRNRLQILLEIDKKASSKPYWFPFSTVAASNDGSGWYCMPKKGDDVRVFFPQSNEKKGYAIMGAKPYIPSAGGGSTAAASAPAASDPMGNPNVKNISTPDGMEIKFAENGVLLISGANNAHIFITNDGVIELSAVGNVGFYAGNQITFLAEGEMSLTAENKISFNCDAGAGLVIEENLIEVKGDEIHQNFSAADMEILEG